MVEPFAESNGDSCSAFEDMPTDLKSLSFSVSDVVSYIAGFICRKLANSLKCAVCVSAMVSNPTFSELIEKKYRGSLVYPGLDIEKLCKEGERKLSHGKSLPSNTGLMVGKRVLQGEAWSDLSDSRGTHDLGDKLGDHFGDLATNLATLATNRLFSKMQPFSRYFY
ncbi:hypothetical protein AVEN_222927-1 [Araneus ventricosus]|uniref:Uncharacterized protein n=1 Tax=Araneus ventricosus TaxID=182803 RepID=A0A4Y2UQS5_ARAVE|nr:hypothetical protein AVEN_87613-1 [Araneus ventricosus]GBO15238.1 hypothetical protein AVEN_222927-1 [Araneus ventricosus]